MEDLFQVGVISSTHGVYGEVKVFPTTDDPKRFRRLKSVIAKKDKKECVLEIENVKFFKQMVILKFKGIDTLDDVAHLRQYTLHVTRENAVRLKKDEYFIADLIDMQVYDEEDQLLGTLTDVLTTGANDVYEIKMTDGRELLLPAIKQCILNVDMEQGKMTVHVLDGLL